jgi:Ca2+-binding RTX toxin-like protein
LPLLFAVTFVIAALPVAAAAAQAPGLPRTFAVKTIETPEPRGGGSFGWGAASADLTGDGRLDLLVAQGQTEPTRVFVFDGASGAHIDTIAPPELNPGGADPVIAFVYVETMPDVGSCPGGDGADADRICDAATVAGPDGIPEIIVGARSKRVDVLDPASEATNADPSLGRGYVIDGATRAVIKRIDMPLADRQAQAALGGGPQFARVMASPQAMAPCAGLLAENNNAGVGPCPPTPRASRIGDLDGDGVGDIVITARNFRETPAQSVPGTICADSTVAFCTNGKAWAYSGAEIAGSDPQAILDTAIYDMQNPIAQTASGEFGGNLYRLGDVDTNVGTTDCFATPGAASCAPEFTIAVRNADYPLASPGIGFDAVGAAVVFKGATGAVHQTRAGTTAVTHPEIQKLSQFSGAFHGGRPVGDLGATTAPDILLPAGLQNAHSTDDGKIWAFNAVGGGGGASGSWQFASMTDPTPVLGGNFGGSFTGAGNLLGGPDHPGNELLVGGFRFDPFTETTNSTVGDVHFVNIESAKNLMTIPNPSGARGDGFGVALVPMGDLNRDGFLDFAATAYLANGVIGSQGRAWIFTSDNSPPPPPPAMAAPRVTGPAVAPTAAASAPAMRPGSCANRTIGTDFGERIRGTLAGDEIFGFAGRDSISGFQGRDCVDGGAGGDRLYGGDANDKLVGRSGNDRLDGGDGRDDLYGGSGADRLYGRHGEDMLAGGSGGDRLFGGRGADRLFGEGGKDRLIGGGGRNRVDGGSGNDSIDVRNGERDRVLCGSGRDRVRADRDDRLNSCERVTYGGKIKYGSSLPRPAAARASSARMRR